MKYITYGERKAEKRGWQKGLLEGIAKGLKLKFGADEEKEKENILHTCNII